MKGYRLILGYLTVVFLLMCLLLFSCCSSVRYVPVESVRSDTVYVSAVVKDSVFVHDSVYVKEWYHGDTVYRDRDRWHTRYVEKQVHDTLYRLSIDSVAVPYPVEKKLTWWERQKIAFGELALVVMSGLLCFLLIKSKLR